MESNNRYLHCDEYFNLAFKVVVVGDPAVGKTSLVQRMSSGEFSTVYKATIGCDFATKLIQWSINTQVSLNFWDIAGQDRILAAVRSYFTNTSGAFCVCDVTRKETREQLMKWKDVVLEKSTERGSIELLNPPCVMIVNKMDLFEASDDPMFSFLQAKQLALKNKMNNNEFGDDGSYFKEEVTIDNVKVSEQDIAKSKELLGSEIDKLAKECGFIGGFAVSVKDGSGLDNAITCLVSEMIKRHTEKEKLIVDEKQQMYSRQDTDVVVLSGHLDEEEERFVKESESSGLKYRSRYGGWFSYC